MHETSIRTQRVHNTKEMIAKVTAKSNSTFMALLPFPASVLSILSITMELNGQT